jgi:ATP-dependent DNA helicase RecQ
MIDASEAAPEFKRLQHRRLESLVAVTLATTCRKQALLRYFGEEVPPCGQCDICVDPPDLTDVTEQACLLFEAIEATGERFGRAHVVDVLRGAATAKVREHRHDRLRQYGAGHELPQAAWQALVRQLVAAGRLDIDLERHGALRLTPAAAAIRGGSDRVRADLRVRRRPAKPEAPPPEQLPPASPAAELFSRLKALRGEIARANGWPAYLVFNDRTLLEMARRRPTSPPELAAIDGVGAKKLESFGPAFLEAIRTAPA